jgi:predicted nuclease with TOPRIM domain
MNTAWIGVIILGVLILICLCWDDSRIADHNGRIKELEYVNADLSKQVTKLEERIVKLEQAPSDMNRKLEMMQQEINSWTLPVKAHYEAVQKGYMEREGVK